MKVLPANIFKTNNKQKTNNKYVKGCLYIKPQSGTDTVCFSGKKIPSIVAPTMEDIINKTKAQDVLRYNILRLAKHDIPCPVCGHLMLPLDKYLEFEQKIKNTTNPKEMLEYIAELKRYLHPVEAKIFEMMKEENLKNPEISLRDILLKKLPQSENKIVAIQSQILGNIGIYCHNLPEKEQSEVRKLINETFARIIDPRETSRFSRKVFLTKLRCIFIPKNLQENLKLKFMEEYEKEDGKTGKYSREDMIEYVSNSMMYTINNWLYSPEQERIIDEAIKIPQAFDNMDAFIVKYAKRDYKKSNPNQQIALRMLSNSLATVEHIKPQSKRGDTVPRNLALECAGDNSRRGADSILSQISENPMMPLNYRKYIKRLCMMHLDKIVEKNYIVQQAKTWKEESLGFLNAELNLLNKREKSPKLRLKMGITPTKAERRMARKEKLKRKNNKKYRQ